MLSQNVRLRRWLLSVVCLLGFTLCIRGSLARAAPERPEDCRIVSPRFFLRFCAPWRVDRTLVGSPVPLLTNGCSTPSHLPHSAPQNSRCRKRGGSDTGF